MLGTVMARRSWALRLRRLSRAVIRSRRSFETFAEADLQRLYDRLAGLHQ